MKKPQPPVVPAKPARRSAKESERAQPSAAGAAVAAAQSAYDRLTPLRQRFVDEYMVDLNAKQAAIRAGSKADRPDQAGYAMLSFADVQLAIAERAAARSEQVQLTAVQVVSDIRRIGQSAEQTGQFAAALKAQELLGKHLGMFDVRVRLGGRDDSPPVKVEAELELTPSEAYMRMLARGD